MGRIKTQLTKRIGKEIFDRHKEVLTTDFDKNKQLLHELTDIESKKIRNVVAGYVTKLTKNRDEF